ncbi:hypothetical protein [Rhizobacter sp. P5_C2]
MTVRNRDTLRSFFGAGMLPTQDHFGDLVDSMLNMSDEGFRKSAENGVEVSTPAGYDALVSFFREQNQRTALWSIAYGGEQDQLAFRPGAVTGRRGQAAAPPVLSLDPRGRVGIGTTEPRQALEVAGVIASEGRIGRYAAPSLPPPVADGEWHDLTGPLEACQAFEVVAGAGRVGGGRFALMHATALNAYNPRPGWLDLIGLRRRIHAQHMWYGRRCDQIQLRWTGSSGRQASYRLQVRTRCDYGGDVPIRASLTRLWFDDEPKANGT